MPQASSRNVSLSAVACVVPSHQRERFLLWRSIYRYFHFLYLFITNPDSMSLTDLYFAHNCGILFYTPESIFLESSFPPSRAYPSPKPDIDFQAIEANSSIDLRALLDKDKRSPELVLLVGSPASGKSTLCDDYFREYQRVNQDTLKTLPKCIQFATKWLKQKVSVVVDNTNPSRDVVF